MHHFEAYHDHLLIEIIGDLFQTAAEEEVLNKHRSKKVTKKYETRQKTAKVESGLEEQFQTGRLLGKNCLLSVSR